MKGADLAMAATNQRKLVSAGIAMLIAASFIVVVPDAYCQSSAGQPKSASPAQSVPATQSVPTAAPVFDVAAIHQNIADQSGHNHIVSSPFDGHFLAINVSSKMLIRWAFHMPETRILDGDSWTNSIMFDIDAKADNSVDAEMRALSSDAGRLQKERMVQALLADRFKLVTHTETRELPIYALVVAKGGPRLGATQASGTTINSGSGHIQVQGSNSVALLAETLARVVGRVVIDKTGIQGRYDIRLTWMPDDGAAPRFNGAEGSSLPSDSGPSIFTAIQEQLGLKLESQKGPVEVLVIDHIEMPSDN
jgi:uncharacterized protein (TIGR03435 family)